MRYKAALSVPFYLIESQRLDGKGWQYSTTTHDPESILPALEPLLEAYGETPVSITITYCEPLIYSVPANRLHKYEEAGERERARRAAL